MALKGIFMWLSGFWGGVFLGALIACPAKVVSLPVSGVLCIAFGWLARRNK